MKTIKFEGKQYEVEEWVKFVTRDCDGEIKFHEFEPYMGADHWCVKGRFYSAGRPNADWNYSLTEV